MPKLADLAPNRLTLRITLLAKRFSFKNISLVMRLWQMMMGWNPKEDTSNSRKQKTTYYWVANGEMMWVYFLLWLFFTLLFIYKWGKLWAFTFNSVCSVVVFLLDAFMVVWSGLHGGLDGWKTRSWRRIQGRTCMLGSKGGSTNFQKGRW